LGVSVRREARVHVVWVGRKIAGPTVARNKGQPLVLETK